MISACRLRELVKYEKSRGLFTWLPRKNVRAGKIAGNIDAKGYRSIRLDGRLYKASRLAFLYVTGEWPIHEVDHRNCIRDDDRWDNLREATRSENLKNRKCIAASGYKGVSLHKQSGKWHSRIKTNGKEISLGYFECPKDANKAYQAASVKYHGEFARA